MQEIELTTEKMAFEGRAIARQDRYVIFVEGALPGERVKAAFFRRKREFGFARVTQVLQPSPHRQPAPCPAFGECGGCTFQQMSYPAQLDMKRDVLLESLHGVPGVPDCVRPVIAADSPFYFRNKMGFAFGSDRDGQTVLGLHKRGDFRSVVLTDICMLQSPQSNEIIRRALNFAALHKIPVHDDVRNQGLLRHLVIREGKHTGERMVHLHAADPHPAFEQFPGALEGLCNTFIVSYHRTVPEDAPAGTTFVLHGRGRIREWLNNLSFEIGSSTFFQTNSLQAEKLFGVLRSWAAEIKPRRAADLYAGTAPIAIHLAAVAERVVAIESNAESVEMAKHNVQINSLENVEILCAEVERTGTDALPKPLDLAVVDPPRAGLHKKAMQILISAAAPHLFYVSCNPPTLARDLKLLAEAGYTVDAIQPVDMFPHTFHIEAVARLRRGVSNQ